MEGCDQNVGNGGSGSRWNPTKEQINMLESLYKQGLRTPSAEQIQQITNRLRAFGHIEGKNVFYWFQNHKARQRQKQKQDNLAYFNRFLHPTNTPVFSPYHNVVCSPCYIPQAKNDLGFYHHQQQYPKVPLPAAGGFKKRLIETENIVEKNKHQMYNTTMHDDDDHHHQETLDLFPIHPTGILQAKNRHENETTASSSENECPIFGNYYERSGNDYGNPFFDFFCGN